MPIPDYQSIMRPLLESVKDGREYKLRDIIEVLAENFKLSEAERRELLPSGQQAVFNNRVAWAKTYLKKARLLDSPRRAFLKITDRGKETLQSHPGEINVNYLKRYPEFVDFQSGKKDSSESETNDEGNEQTPEETLESSYLKIRKALAQDLLNRIIELPPSFFEKLVVELLVKMGYGGSIKDAGRAMGKSGDEGIDGTIKEDKLGLDIIYIQAKRWQPGNVVGRPEIQKFVGALAGQGAKKGIFITTSRFSQDATDYIPRNETKIVLLDGEQVSQLMIDYNLGVTVQQTFELKKIDNDYFGDE